MFGVEIHFKNGKKEWIDPVEEEPVEKEDTLFVSNIYYTYEYQLSAIANYIKYDLCPTCLFDKRDCDCGGC